MKRLNRLSIGLALGLTLTAAVGPLAQLTAKDHQKIGESLSSYYTAKDEGEGITDAKSDIKKVLDKFSEKLSKKAKAEVDVLSLTDDMSASFLWVNEISGRPAVGKIKEFTFETNFGDLEVAIHAPKKYKASKGAVPLILTIPEEGQKLSTHINEEWKSSDVRDGAVIAALKMPKNVDLWAKSSMDPLGGLQTIMLALREIRKLYFVDPDRIYICGRADGVEAAAHVASIFPSLFAGVIGRSGDLMGTGPKNFGNIHTYFAGGGSNVTAFGDKAKALGYETVTIEPKGDIDAIWKWIEGHPRISNPARIDFELNSPMAADSYWITASGFDPEENPVISAEVDREKNVIVVTASKVATVTINLNDLLVDLDREVTVICNGVTHKNTFSRSLETMLILFYKSNDSGRIYTAFDTYDIPELEEE